MIVIIALAACKTQDKKGNHEMTPEERRKDSLQNEINQKMMTDTANYTTIEWIDSTFRPLGNVKEGDPVSVSYKFRNTGNHPLVIFNATAGCGCTTPEKPKEPIAPGETGEIKAGFNSNGRKGPNRKSIFIDANTKPSRSHELVFEVTVE